MNCPAHKLESQRIQFNCVGVCQTLESCFESALRPVSNGWTVGADSTLLLYCIQLSCWTLVLACALKTHCFLNFLELSNALYCIQLSCIASFSNCWSGVLNAVNGFCHLPGFVSFGNKQLSFSVKLRLRVC